MIPDRAENAANWPIDKLTIILLRQFKRLLAERDVSLNDITLRAIGKDVAERRAPRPEAVAVREALPGIVDESMDLLAGWDLSFERSLATDMNDLAHLWQTTAEFLDLANEKINAEVRISAGSALMALLDDHTNVGILLTAIEHDLKAHGALDVDAVIAKRALLHAAQIDPAADDWLERARQFRNDSAG
jgi:hypothetical protein